jgi:hypothetical protein
MYSIDFPKNVVVRFSLVPIEILLPHEHVLVEKIDSLKEYICNHKPWVILPAIIVCEKTNVIIDGHHRYFALLKIGVKKIPVVYINYYSNLIIAELNKMISKEQIIEAGISGKLLKPKSSFHHIVDIFGNLHPLILISPLCEIKLLNETNNSRP